MGWFAFTSTEVYSTAFPKAFNAIQTLINLAKVVFNRAFKSCSSQANIPKDAITNSIPDLSANKEHHRQILSYNYYFDATDQHEAG